MGLSKKSICHECYLIYPKYYLIFLKENVRLVQIMTQFLPNKTELILNINGFFMILTGLVLIMTGFVPDMTYFFLNITDFVLDSTGLNLYKTGFVLNRIKFVLDLVEIL